VARPARVSTLETFVQDPSDDRDARSIESAEEWIGAQDPEKGPPLFVWVHLVGPHLIEHERELSA
jgi:hypothetical protein